MADDRLLCCRALSISATTFDSVIRCTYAISLKSFQNGSSRLTLVLCPSITTERLMTGDFMAAPQKFFISIFLMILSDNVGRKLPCEKHFIRDGIQSLGLGTTIPSSTLVAGGDQACCGWPQRAKVIDVPSEIFFALGPVMDLSPKPRHVFE